MTDTTATTAPVANPAALGLVCFGMTTNATWGRNVIPLG